MFVQHVEENGTYDTLISTQMNIFPSTTVAAKENRIADTTGLHGGVVMLKKRCIGRCGERPRRSVKVETMIAHCPARTRVAIF